MNILSPKAQFQANEKLRTETAAVVNSSNFQLTLSFALADFVSQSRPTTEELAGVRKFIDVLLNLPFPEPSAPEFPMRRLGERPPPETKSK